MASTVCRNQTGSTMCRAKRVFTSSGSLGNGAAKVHDHTGTSVGLIRHRPAAAWMACSPSAKTGVWNAERNGNSWQRTLFARRPSMSRCTCGRGPFTMHCVGALSCESNTPGCSASRASRLCALALTAANA
jgi:hypothetical protein